MPPVTQTGNRRYSAIRLMIAIILFGYSVVLITATHLPTVNGLVRYPGIDKVLHLIAYGCLASLAAALATVGRNIRFRHMLGLAILLAGFAILDEVTQPFFNRKAELGDWIADCLGIIGGMSCVILLYRITAHRARQENKKND